MACAAGSLRGRPGRRPVAAEAGPRRPASWSSAVRSTAVVVITPLSLSTRRPGGEVPLPNGECVDGIDPVRATAVPFDVERFGGHVERGLPPGRSELRHGFGGGGV